MAAGVTVTASRVTDTETRTATITTAAASAGSTVMTATQGPRIAHAERRYRIPAADYLLGAAGVACEPREGDQFAETIEGTAYTFEAKPVNGEPAWVYSDAGKTLLRINVKRVTGR